MSKVRYKIENEAALAMLTAFETVWNSFCRDKLSSETKKSYYSLIKNIEHDVNLPKMDTIKNYEIFIIGENTD